MSRYVLQDDVRKEYKPIIEQFINKVNAITDNEIENINEKELVLQLSDTKLNPYTLQQLLEEDFDYEQHEIDSNGWQMDFWITLSKSNNELAKNITISGTGITFELKLSIEIS